MKFQVCKTVLMSAQADNRFTEGPDFNPGCSF
jgi:hypothetical protein